MQTAAIPNLIKTIIWIFAIYYLIKYISKLLLPILAKKMMQKAEEHLKQQQQNYQQQQNQQTKKPETQSKKVGDYIDYEEIE